MKAKCGDYLRKIHLLVIFCIAFLLCGMFSAFSGIDCTVYAQNDQKQTQKVKIGVLQRGTNSPYVKKVQQLLAAKGYYFDTIDGIFGKNTEEAVREFQRDHKLKVTGIVDSKTLNKLQSTEIAPRKVKKELKVNASAYSAQDPGCSNYTCTGQRLKKGIVAVDPKVIPLGTKMYIPGYGYGVAADIGSAIKGHRIDVAFESRKEALKFGRRNIVIQILE